MSKKIYDILPPKVAHRLENFLTKDSKAKTSRRKSRNRIHKKNLPLREILVGGGVILILFVIYFVSQLPRTEIQIRPKTDVLAFEEQITAEKSVEAVDLARKMMPAQYIEQEQEGWQVFEATGEVSNDSKASGTITIYNKVKSSTPLTLKTGTHFLSDSGKYFVTLKKITVPASSKNLPGSIKVKVEAQEAGPEYNIGASKFSVPKLAGTEYYYTIWGESNTDMTGGYRGSVKKVTKDDIAKAKDSLAKNLLDQAENLLKSRLSSDDVLLNRAVARNVLDVSSDVKAESIIDTFSQSAKVKVSALLFKKQDLDKFVKDDILSRLPESKKFLEKSLEINYTPVLIDISKGVEKVDLQLSVKTYQNIDSNILINLSQRKSSGQIKEIIRQMYGDKVSEIKVNFWPFWVQKSPKDKDRIKINLLFE